ncbi:class I SAM-dependent methyltransferase [Helicobacter sp. WB40]|uniref:class I SAM-dependent methyltransferase n=1 Tax=Helicobacter sp. WB40 TaxID=3004130 RepID=UPI0022EBCEA4|nr:class I SAM-dependent methyltransferase [Helicobacter sp. WB40]MDA3967055.1 class I SAM-dependent methyltransferase [Helicobacter sp. WB40]
MESWSDGYFTNTEYTEGYYKEISPMMINLNLALAGVEVGNEHDITPKDGFSYLELGYGMGISITLNAATNNGIFYGTDFTPTHTHKANIYANGLDNITLYNDSFEELLERLNKTRLEFDYIVFHGIFSWISRENQDIILEIIRKFLKPGGIVYNSYNCMPSWSSKMALREIFRMHNRHYTNASTGAHESIANSANFLKEFMETNPMYFQGNQIAQSLVTQLTQSNNHKYLGHEYLNSTWDIFYFHEIAERMQDMAKCSYITMGEILEHFNEWTLRPEWVSYLSNIKDKIFQEQLKDFCLNRQFRKDIYCKGVAYTNHNTAKTKLLNTKFALVEQKEKFSTKMQFVLGEGTLKREKYDSVLEYLESKNYTSKTGWEISEKCKLQFQELMSILAILMQQGIVSPAQTISDTIKNRTKIYNQNIIKNKEKSILSASYIASPVTCSAIAINDLHRFMLGFYMQGITAENNLITRTIEKLKELDSKPIKDGKTLTTDSEIKKEITQMANEFKQKIGIFKNLGIID